MKKKIYSALALAIILTSCMGIRPKSDGCKSGKCCSKSDTTVCCTKEKADETKCFAVKRENSVEVLTFHNAFRCETCVAIENLTREVVEMEFANELKLGQLTMSVVDMSTEEGAAIAQRYNVNFTSLFLNKWESGVERRNNLTDIAFAKALNSPVEFKALIKSRLSLLLG